MKKPSIIGKFIIWRTHHISDRYFVIILSVLIGFVSGIAAYVLKTAVYYFSDTLRGDNNQPHFLINALLPAIGILLTILFIRLIIRDNVRHGIPRILYVISRQNSRMKKHKTFSSLVGATLTAGFGASVGLESPIISTGASFGSTLGQVLRLNYRTTTLLIGCGAAGAMASIFNTPIAAVIFGLEVLMLDLATSSIVPLLIASVAGSITTKLLLAERVLINFEITDHFQIGDVPFYIVFGLVLGFISFYFSRIYRLVEVNLRKVKNQNLASLFGVLSLAVLIFVFPPLFGEGYDGLKLLITGNHEELFASTIFSNWKHIHWIVLVFLVLLMFFKVVATALSVESGGVGGIFAPSAFTGGLAGFGFAYFLNMFPVFGKLSTSNFTLVGMAGALGGILHAPLTAIFLVAEITNGYDLIVPLMLTTAIAFITSKVLDPHSIFTKQLAERGELITHHKDQAVLTLLNVKQVIDQDIETIEPGKTLKDLVEVISKAHRNVFPVVDKEKTFYGLITLDEVREDMFKPEKYNKPIEDYIFQLSENEKVSTCDTMEVVMDKFSKTDNYNLAVIDQGVYVGLVSRANIFKAYRKTLIDVSHE
jgi:CIC family chloride channel protein